MSRNFDDEIKKPKTGSPGRKRIEARWNTLKNRLFPVDEPGREPYEAFILNALLGGRNIDSIRFQALDWNFDKDAERWRINRSKLEEYAVAAWNEIKEMATQTR